uniref:Putative secreted peptide n=1 Tax=Anopheles braziliensis TaxID=58242 RepID=A0A2M3ZSI2_9DIPT
MLVLLQVLGALLAQQLTLCQRFLRRHHGPGLEALEIVERNRVLDGGIPRHAQLAISLRTERILWLQDKPARFLLVELLQGNFHAGHDAHLFALVDRKLDVALLKHAPLVTTDQMQLNHTARIGPLFTGTGVKNKSLDPTI